MSVAFVQGVPDSPACRCTYGDATQCPRTDHNPAVSLVRCESCGLMNRLRESRLKPTRCVGRCGTFYAEFSVIDHLFQARLVAA